MATPRLLLRAPLEVVQLQCAELRVRAGGDQHGAAAAARLGVAHR